jgi:quercetin dioxygenase-like cupin family protein
MNPSSRWTFRHASPCAPSIAGEVAELGLGQAFLAPPNVEHEVRALEDTVVLSCKNVVGGYGHRLPPEG